MISINLYLLVGLQEIIAVLVVVVQMWSGCKSGTKRSSISSLCGWRISNSSTVAVEKLPKSCG